MDWRAEAKIEEACIMAVRREQQFEIEGEPDALVEPVVRTLVEMSCSRFGRDGLTITARSSWSWRSLGEVITVTLAPAGPGRTRVTAASASALPTVLLDWGVNAANLARFERLLRRRLAEAAMKAG